MLKHLFASRITLFLFIIIGYVLVGNLGLYFATINNSASPFWPASGFAVAMVLIFGRSATLAIFLGALLVNLPTQVPTYVAGLIAVGNSLEALAAWYLRLLVLRNSSSILHHKEALFTIVIAIVAPITSASFGSFTLWLGGSLPPTSIIETWLTWWIGDGLGVLLTTPFILAIKKFKINFELRLKGQIPNFLILSGYILSLAIVFLTPFGATLLFLLFGLSLVAAIALKPIESRAFTLLVGLAAILFTFYGFGPFTLSTTNINLINLQFFLAALGLTGLLLEGIRKMGPLLLPSTVLLIGWVISGFLFYSTNQRTIDDIEKKFERQIRTSNLKIENYMSLYESVLMSGMGFYNSSDEVRAPEWSTFIQSQNIQNRYIGLQGVGVILNVPKEELNNFVRFQKRTNSPDFKIHSLPNGESTENRDYFIITYIEPKLENQRAIGFDVGSETSRRRAAEAARDKARLTLSKKITLVQDPKERPAFLLYYPIYKSKEVPQTVLERRQKLTGWVYSPVITEDFFRGALGETLENIQISVFEDPEMKKESLVFSHGETSEESPMRPFRKVSKIQLAGHDFYLGWNRSRSFTPTELHSSWAAFSGAIITLLFATLAATLQTINARAQSLADRQTMELVRGKEALKEIRERYELAVKGSHDGIWDWDIKSSTVYFSPRWKEILGYEDHEISNTFESWNQLIHSDDKERAHIEIQAYLQKTIPQYEFEGRFRHKSGVYKWALVRGDALWDSNGNAYRMAGSLTDVTARKESEIEITKARMAALTASQAKSQFLANISHELRTPLSCILGSVNLLCGGKLNADQYDFVEVISQSANLLLDTINDVLDFSKIEAGKLDIEILDFDLLSLVDDVCKVMKFSAAQKGLELTVDFIGFDDRGFRGDSTRIRQILVNLLSNAIKFSKTGVVQLTVKVNRVSDSESVVHFEIKDQGIGIPSGALSSIFDAFTQAENSTNRRFGGTGLGLSICKRLVQLMNGKIFVESKLGQGSTFSFEIPMGRSETIKSLASTFIEDIEVTKGLNILLAEDNLINQRVTAAALKQLGYNVVGVNNGRHALDTLKSKSFDIILMDCQMPELDGYETTNLIRKSPSYNAMTTPIVAITANALREDRDRCLAAGMNEYLPKPLKLDKLVQVIETLVKTSDRTTLTRESFNVEALTSLSDPHKLGSPEFKRTIIELFLQSSPQILESIQTGVEEGDFKRVQKEIHNLGTSCAVLGLDYALDLCRKIEALKLEDSKAISDLFLKVKNEIASRSRDLDQYRI